MKLTPLFEQIIHAKNPQLALRSYLKAVEKTYWSDENDLPFLAGTELITERWVILIKNRGGLTLGFSHRQGVPIPIKQLKSINNYFDFSYLPVCRTYGVEAFHKMLSESGYVASIRNGEENISTNKSLIKQAVQTLKYGAGTLDKSGKVSKNLFQAIYYMRNNVPGKWGWKKLSDLYQSRTTNLSSVYGTDCFVQSTDREDVAAGGFAPTTKSVIMLNTSNPIVQEVLSFVEKFESENMGRYTFSNEIYQAYLKS